MCTMISKTIPVKGSAKESEGWFDINTINISYDHPFEADLGYAINLDIPNQSSERFSRIILELSPQSASALIEGLQQVLASGHTIDSHSYCSSQKRDLL